MIRKTIVALVLMFAIGVIGTATLTRSATPAFAQDTGTQETKKSAPKKKTVKTSAPKKSAPKAAPKAQE